MLDILLKLICPFFPIIAILHSDDVAASSSKLSNDMINARNYLPKVAGDEASSIDSPEAHS